MTIFLIRFHNVVWNNRDYKKMNNSLQKIMHIDDEDDIREITNIILSSTGEFEVRSFDRGQTGIEAISEFRPDLIICDVMMPEKTGPETLQELRKNGVQTPLFFMTAKVQDYQVEELMAFGAQGVIKKPYDPMALPDQVKNMWQNL